MPVTNSLMSAAETYRRPLQTPESPSGVEPAAFQSSPNGAPRAVPEELRASLAGAARSPAINETYITELKAKAEERAANARAMRSRTAFVEFASQVATTIAAATVETGEASGQEASGGGSVPLATARAAYRSNGA